MNNNSNKKNSFKVIIGFFVLGLIFIGTSQIKPDVFSREVSINQQARVRFEDYEPLVTIPGLINNSLAEGNYVEYMQIFFNWGIALAIVLSILMIIIGGIQYMSIDSISGKSEGITKIQGAVVGLILALSAWIILNAIDPRILEYSVPAVEASSVDNLFFMPNNINNI